MTPFFAKLLRFVREGKAVDIDFMSLKNPGKKVRFFFVTDTEDVLFGGWMFVGNRTYREHSITNLLSHLTVASLGGAFHSYPVEAKKVAMIKSLMLQDDYVKKILGIESDEPDINVRWVVHIFRTRQLREIRKLLRKNVELLEAVKKTGPFKKINPKVLAYIKTRDDILDLKSLIAYDPKAAELLSDKFFKLKGVVAEILRINHKIRPWYIRHPGADNFRLAANISFYLNYIQTDRTERINAKSSLAFLRNLQDELQTLYLEQRENYAIPGHVKELWNPIDTAEAKVLRTKEEYVEEGTSMDHCVGGYFGLVRGYGKNGYSFNYCYHLDNPEPATIEIAVTTEPVGQEVTSYADLRYVQTSAIQVRGPKNAVVSQKTMEKVALLVKDIDAKARELFSKKEVAQ